MECPIIIYFHSIVILPFLLKSRGYQFRYPLLFPSIYLGISPHYLFSFPCYLGNMFFDVPWSPLEIQGISVSISPSVPLDIFGNIPSVSILIPLLSGEYLFWCPLISPWNPGDISFDIPLCFPRYIWEYPLTIYFHSLVIFLRNPGDRVLISLLLPLDIKREYSLYPQNVEMGVSPRFQQGISGG